MEGPLSLESVASGGGTQDVFRREVYEQMSPSSSDRSSRLEDVEKRAAPSQTPEPQDPTAAPSKPSSPPPRPRPRDRIDYRPQGGPLLTYLWCEPAVDDSRTSSTIDVEAECEHEASTTATTMAGSSDVVDDVAPTDPTIQDISRGKEEGEVHESSGNPIDENENSENEQSPSSSPPVDATSSQPPSHGHRHRHRTPHPTTTVLSGQTLYLGGEIGCDGNLYCIPGHSRRVLKVDVADGTDRVTLIGPDLPGKFKWLRGVSMGTVIYGLPCHADCVLRIHVPTQTVSTIDISYEQFYGSDNVELAIQQRHQEWKYHGGSVSPHNGCLYGIPQSALHVLKIDPVTEIVSLVGPPLPGRYKWYGGIVGHNDGAIYGIPHNATGVLRIGKNDQITVHGQYDEGGHKWHGAAAAPPGKGGAIVSVPANADTVLCIYPNAPTDEDDDPAPTLLELGGPDTVQTGRHRTDRKYKYLGAMAGPDGNVYCFPSGSERVLQVNADTRTVRPVGPNLYDAQMERLCQNKWQNGVCVNNVNEQAVYAIPLAAESVLRIDCGGASTTGGTGAHDPVVTTWPLPEPYKGLAKWEGAVLAPNGVIYTVPNNHKAILRIESPSRSDANGYSTSEPEQQSPSSSLEPSAKRDDVPYGSGIPTLRSSAHRVKHTSKGDNGGPRPKDRSGQETVTTFLPQLLCRETILDYDVEMHPLVDAVRRMLQACDDTMVGSFEDSTESAPRLESFRVPTASTWRTVNGGRCEAAQRYLSDQVASCDDFLAVFDDFVRGAVLPHIKGRLVEAGLASDEPGSVKFYYQRPPTLRLQPGPAWAQVKPHNDAEYGHQNGELNVWVPLTDRELTEVDLWVESSAMAGDYHPLPARPGQAILFHGSSCRHYVNPNASTHTRVSLDFRVGVEGYFDAEWEMRGTTDDHSRRETSL